MFRDEVEIYVKAGDGGDGCVAFHREKYITKGGPDGGEGGDGGDVIFISDAGLNTLYHLTERYHYVAANGERGTKNNCAGKGGRDLEVLVPAGTVVKDLEHGHVLKDLSTAGERFVIAKGGRGGRGNFHFSTPSRQTPDYAEQGRPGEERKLLLELKLIAEVGLVGLPNAGKSTLLSRLSAARPKIADYPFTTLVPYLGIVAGPGFKSLVMADLPGLIEGAHQGIGLGDRFLRHIERTRIIVHLIDAAPIAPPDPVTAYRVIRNELSSYSAELAAKPEIVVANKLDLPEAKENVERLRAELGVPVFAISGVTGAGLKELLYTLFERLAEVTSSAPAAGDRPA